METYYGIFRTALDTILLFEFCRIGLLKCVPRHLLKEEQAPIRVGSVFVWDDSEANMKRWTDGRAWNASRIHDFFLNYNASDDQDGRSPRSTCEILKFMQLWARWNQVTDMNKGRLNCSCSASGLMKRTFSLTTLNRRNLHHVSYCCRLGRCDASLYPPVTPWRYGEGRMITWPTLEVKARTRRPMYLLPSPSVFRSNALLSRRAGPCNTTDIWSQPETNQACR